MWRTGILLLLAIAALAGCGNAEPADEGGGAATGVSADALDGRSFVATSVRGHELVAGSELTLAFERDRLSARAGCNTLAGGWSIEDGRLRAADLAQTQIGCEERLARQDAWLASFLGAGPRVALDGDQLTLTGEDATIVLAPGRASGTLPPIVGTRWRLESIGGAGDTVSSVPSGVRAPTLQIAENGDVALFAGCNRGGGRADVREDGFIDFGPLALTKKACDQAAMQVEAAVTGLLRGSVAAGFSGQNLSLARDGRRLEFAPVG